VFYRHQENPFMLINYLKAAWRSLVFNKKYTAINITGLGVSIAACILIGVSVYNETSFDSQIPDRSNVYRLNEFVHYDGAPTQLSAASGPPIAGFLKNNHSEIESYTRVYEPSPTIFPAATLEYNGNKFSSEKLVCTDSSFAKMFGINIIAGNKNEFIPLQNNLALTESTAKKIFGNEQALNKTVFLRIDDRTFKTYVVSHVIKDLPANSHIQADAMLPIPAEFEKSFSGDNYGILLGPTYLRLRSGTDIKTLEAKLTKTVQTKNKWIDMRLQPVSDLHAGSTLISYDYFNHNKIDGKYINLFIIIAITIFIIACCNFINLNIAIAAYRGKEMGIKKIAGASRWQLMMQLLTEAFVSVLMSLVLAVLLAHFSLPWLNKLMNRNIPVSDLYQWPVLAAYLVIMFTATILAGIYPAISIAYRKVNLSLQSKVIYGGSRSSVRNILATGQFAIAVIFIVCLIVFVKQVQFIQNKDLGYSFWQVIRLPIDAKNAARTDLLKTGLSSIKGVTDVTHGYIEMGTTGHLMGIDYKDAEGQTKKISVNFENVATNYVPFFDMKILSGQNFTAGNHGSEYIVNETLARQLGFDNPIGKPINLSSWPAGKIVAVVKDFNYSSLHSKIEPLIIGSIDFVPQWKAQLYVKISTADVFNTIQQIESAWKKLSGNEVANWQFMDDHFKDIYQSEKQAGTMVAIIGGLSIAIACLGLLGLAAFVMAKRTKEIGIRKVLGASVTSVVGSLSKEFMRMVVIAFILASPIAYWVSDGWLQNFAYRIDISWWMFALAGGITVFIAFGIVIFLAVKAAVANPVLALRNE
jgi:putative ABC transport system permease protein